MRIRDWSSDVCSSDLGCDDADSFANGLYETEAPLGASKGMRDPLASPVVIDPLERKDLQSRGMPIECLRHRRSQRDNWKVGDYTSVQTPSRMRPPCTHRSSSAERRLGDACVRKCRSRWAVANEEKKTPKK